MDPFYARTLVETLSKGIDPISGRALPDNHCCVNEELQEALTIVLENCSIESNEQYLARMKEEKKAKRKENGNRYPRAGEQWTREEESRLVCLHNNGKSQYQIVNILHRSPGAVYGKLKSFGNDPLYNAGKPWTVEEDKRLRYEFASKRKISDIAKEHGRTKGAIESRLKHLELKK